MWSSSELSISRSIPVILPARLGCMFWINGNSRSPVKETDGADQQSKRNRHQPESDRKSPRSIPSRPLGKKARGIYCHVGVDVEVLFGLLTQHLFLFLEWSGSQHGGSQGFLALNMDCRLRAGDRRVSEGQSRTLFRCS